jgi:DNA-binding XRE family transcriptional regulator
MEQRELAAAAGVNRTTLIDFEKGERTPQSRTVAAIRAALEAAGVEFIAENGGGAGVRLARPSGPASASG